MSIRIHIADDHAVFRAGVRALIAKEDDLEVVGESGNSFDSLKQAQETKIDVLLLDINMPGMPTADVVKTLSKETPETAVLVLTFHDEEYYFKEFLKVGALGFMVKTSTGSELVQAIRIVNSKKQYIDPAMSQYLVSSYLGHSPGTGMVGNNLTKRELEVCEKLALGYTNEEAAESLSVSKRTIDSHRASIMSKLELKGRAELVRFALEHGLLKS